MTSEQLTRYFAELVREHDKLLTNFALSYVKRYDLAEEIVSDVFYKLWENKDTISSIENIKSYLYVATKNHCLNYIKSKMYRADLQTEHPASMDFLIERFDPEESFIHKELEAKLEAAIQSLPHGCKVVFQMVRANGLKQQQVAEILGISPKTVENQLAKAIKKIRQELEAYRHGDQHSQDGYEGIAVCIAWMVAVYLG